MHDADVEVTRGQVALERSDRRILSGQPLLDHPCLLV